MDDEEITETAPDTPVQTAVQEAENTAETAIDIADNAHERITQLELALTTINDRLAGIESSIENDRSNAGNNEPIPVGSGLQTATNGDSNSEARPTEEEHPTIKPKREHFYYRKLW